MFSHDLLLNLAPIIFVILQSRLLNFKSPILFAGRSSQRWQNVFAHRMSRRTVEISSILIINRCHTRDSRRRRWYCLALCYLWVSRRETFIRFSILPLLNCGWIDFFLHLRNQPAVIDMLLTHGMNVNIVNKSQCSALHIAVNKQFRQCVKVLLCHQCDPNLQVRVIHVGLYFEDCEKFCFKIIVCWGKNNNEKCERFFFFLLLGLN